MTPKQPNATTSHEKAVNPIENIPSRMVRKQVYELVQSITTAMNDEGSIVINMHQKRK